MRAPSGHGQGRGDPMGTRTSSSVARTQSVWARNYHPVGITRSLGASPGMHGIHVPLSIVREGGRPPAHRVRVSNPTEPHLSPLSPGTVLNPFEVP